MTEISLFIYKNKFLNTSYRLQNGFYLTLKFYFISGFTFMFFKNLLSLKLLSSYLFSINSMKYNTEIGRPLTVFFYLKWLLSLRYVCRGGGPKMAE